LLQRALGVPPESAQIVELQNSEDFWATQTTTQGDRPNPRQLRAAPSGTTINAVRRLTLAARTERRGIVRTLPQTSAVTRAEANTSKATESELASPQTTLSQLTARILDQLSVSAWLPAAVFVFLLLLVGAIRHAGGDVADAVNAIASMKLSAVLLLFGAVILATTLTQAFEFEAIRLLEGYWGPGRVRVAVAELLCRCQTRRRERLVRRHDRAARLAFDAALPALLDDEVSPQVIKIMRARVYALPVPAGSPDHLAEANARYWLDDVPASSRRRLDAMSAALRRYPSEESRILPSRLGNTLRYYEERVHDRGVGELENYVQAVFHQLLPHIQLEHDQFRSRLDLYSSLVLVFAVAGVIALVELEKFGLKYVLIGGGLAIALMFLSYRAAIASARAYGGVLEIIAESTSRDT
jgi:hypothetical protein